MLFKPLIVLLLITSCTTIKKQNSEVEGNYEIKTKKEIEDKLGGAAAYIPNESMDFLLCYRSSSKASDLAATHHNPQYFIIWDVEKKAIVDELRISKGSVSWHSPTTLLVNEELGMMDDQGNSVNSFIYNIESKTRTTLQEDTSERQ